MRSKIEGIVHTLTTQNWRLCIKDKSIKALLRTAEQNKRETKDCEFQMLIEMAEQQCKSVNLLTVLGGAVTKFGKEEVRANLIELSRAARNIVDDVMEKKVLDPELILLMVGRVCIVASRCTVLGRAHNSEASTLVCPKWAPGSSGSNGLPCEGLSVRAQIYIQTMFLAISPNTSHFLCCAFCFRTWFSI
jgi:hypothetical protein